MLYNTKKRLICIRMWGIFSIFAPSKHQKMNICERLYTGFLLLLVLASCSCKRNVTGDTSSTKGVVAQTVSSEIPHFSADSAYQYVAAQCDFGPRIPGTETQETCARWLENELRRHGAVVKVQKGEMKAYNGAMLPVRNIFGSFNAEAKMRVLLVSHWDSRPVADNDPDPAKRKLPVMGANDGASGVGVLLELARLCSQKRPQVGIDIFLTDAEDYGAPVDWPGNHDEKWWALGTQMWCKQAAKEGYRAQYGILLDMVGSQDATFYREYYSERYANSFVNEIWQTAARLGYGALFINRGGGGVTDDHVFINRMLNIPCVDIIDTRVDADGSFCPEWHTTYDTMDNISKETLGKVGRVLVSLLW